MLWRFERHHLRIQFPRHHRHIRRIVSHAGTMTIVAIRPNVCTIIWTADAVKFNSTHCDVVWIARCLTYGKGAGGVRLRTLWGCEWSTEWEMGCVCVCVEQYSQRRKRSRVTSRTTRRRYVQSDMRSSHGSRGGEIALLRIFATVQ